MKLFIDDHKVDAEPVGDGTLGDALRHVQATLCSPGRLVVSLRCDGQDIPAGEMASTLNRPVSSFQQLEISTSTQGELVQELGRLPTVSELVEVTGLTAVTVRIGLEELGLERSIGKPGRKKAAAE